MLTQLFLLVVTFAFAQAQSECVPNYQLVHSACKATGQIKGREAKVISDQLVNAGACHVANALDYCNQFDKAKLLQNFPGAKLEDVRVRNPKLEPTLELCGGLTEPGGVRRKVNIYCTFEIDLPIMEKVAHETCPIVDVLEVAGCFERNEIVVDDETLSSCTRLQPKQSGDWWKKAACLADLNRAAHLFNVKGLNQTKAAEIERQYSLLLKLTAEKSALEPVNNYLRVQQRKWKN